MSSGEETECCCCCCCVLLCGVMCKGFFEQIMRIDPKFKGGCVCCLLPFSPLLCCGVMMHALRCCRCVLSLHRKLNFDDRSGGLAHQVSSHTLSLSISRSCFAHSCFARCLFPSSTLSLSPLHSASLNIDDMAVSSGGSLWRLYTVRCGRT